MKSENPPKISGKGGTSGKHQSFIFNKDIK
jgi:hypothetical protein